MAPATFLAVFNIIYNRLYFEFRQNVLISFMVPLRITRRFSHELHLSAVSLLPSPFLMVHAAHRTDRAKVMYRRVRVCLCINVGFKTAFMIPIVFVHFVIFLP
jgi:hypothetical protein